jgi:hypothetical protein
MLLLLLGNQGMHHLHPKIFFYKEDLMVSLLGVYRSGIHHVEI